MKPALYKLQYLLNDAWRDESPRAGKLRRWSDESTARAACSTALLGIADCRVVPADAPSERTYESTTEPGLYYWAEATGIPGSKVESYMVVVQVVGYPGTEACDDWFANLADAEEVARQLAAGIGT